MSKKVTPVVESKIHSMRAGGASLRQISAETGVSHTTVRNYLEYGSNTAADAARAENLGYDGAHGMKNDYAVESGHRSFHDYKMSRLKQRGYCSYKQYQKDLQRRKIVGEITDLLDLLIQRRRVQ